MLASGPGFGHDHSLMTNKIPSLTKIAWSGVPVSVLVPILAIAAAAGLLSTASIGDAAAPAAPRAFASCKACHSVEPGEMRSGPSLAGIVGRRAGTAAGFGYSEGMRASGKVWTEQELDAFLANPAGAVPGTRMPLPTRNAEARQAIIAYLKTV